MNRESTHPSIPSPIELSLPDQLRVAAREPSIPQFTTAYDAHTWWIRLVNAGGRRFEPVGHPDPTRWWDRACRQNANAGEPTPETVAALGAFTDALNQDAALNFVGKIAAWLDCTRMAGTHLRVEHALRADPEIKRTALPTPVFVLGLFRSGTTVLHRLLGEDPDNRTLPHWESFDPTPNPEGPVAVQRKLTRFLGLADVISPHVKSIHPMDAYQTDECRGMFTNVFRTPQLNVQFRVSSYVDWLFEQDATVAYHHHRRQLQLAFHQRPHGTRLVLKDPTHMFFVDAIREVYPDARFIFIHRDPADTLSSICSLHAYTRSIFSDDVDAHAIGREILGSYLVERLEPAVASVDRLPPDRVAHVRAPDLSRDPVGTVAAAYGALGMTLGDEAAKAMHAYMEDKRRRRSPRHHHTATGFGLDAEAIRERFSAYCERFDL